MLENKAGFNCEILRIGHETSGLSSRQSTLQQIKHFRSEVEAIGPHGGNEKKQTNDHFR